MWLLKFYHTETAYRCGIVAYQKVVHSSRQAAINEAEALIRNGGYKYYEIFPA